MDLHGKVRIFLLCATQASFGCLPSMYKNIHFKIFRLIFQKYVFSLFVYVSFTDDFFFYSGSAECNANCPKCDHPIGKTPVSKIMLVCLIISFLNVK